MNIKEIYIDGAARGNGKGVSSYAVIIKLADGTTKKLGEAFMYKTNNQMELMAACKAMLFLTKARDSGDMDPEYTVPIYTDSMLLYNMFARKWLYEWEVKGTIDAHGNNDLLWTLLLQSYEAGKFRFYWVKAHANNAGNIEADRYCNELMDRYLNGKV